MERGRERRREREWYEQRERKRRWREKRRGKQEGESGDVALVTLPYI